MTNKKSYVRRSHRDASVRYTLAERFLVAGQRLRANEPMVATSLALNYAAKWQQAAGGAR